MQGLRKIHRFLPAAAAALGSASTFQYDQQQQQREFAPVRRSLGEQVTECAFFFSSPPPLRRMTTVQRMRETASKDKVDNLYDVNWKKPIGKGMFGDVFQGKHLSTNEKVAIKKISKRFTNNEAFQREMDNLLFLEQTGGHPSICQLREHFDSEEYYYLVLDLVQGGELFEHLSRYGPYSEADAARLIRQTASALAFLHGIGVVHCDMKPENLMLSSKKEEHANIKIVDFGCAHRIADASKSSEENKQSRPSGLTPGYAPPEAIQSLLDGNYFEMDPSFDMWSLGVIMYIILTGCHPFDWHGVASNEDLEERILNGDGPFIRDSKFTRGLSDEALDVLERLMERDPQKRITAQELLAHPWVRGETASSTVISGSDKRLAAYQRHQTKIVTLLFKSMLTNADKHAGSPMAKRTSILEMAFRDLDTKNRGYISTNELTGISSFLSADSKLSLSVLQHLVKDDMTPYHHEKGKVIYEESSKGDSMYFLQSGSVEVKSKSGFRAIRQAGSFFGEEALTGDKGEYSETVTCLTPVDLLEVSRDYFEKYLNEDEDVGMAMQENDRVRQRERAKVLLSLSKDLKTEEYNPGTTIFQEGSNGNTLYILEKGNVDITASGRKVRSLRDGEMTGEHAAYYSDRPYNVTAKCIGPGKCTMQLLDGKHIRRMCNRNKDLDASFRDIILRRDFKKSLVHMTGQDFPETEDQLRAAFNAIDSDGSGEITFEKIKEAVHLWDKTYTESDIHDMLNSLDIKGQGKLTWPDFKRIFSMFNEM